MPMKSFRVLVVDDDFVSAKVAELTISQMGHSVVGVAPSAEEGIAMARLRRPDVVLMDFMLGAGMNGAQAAKVVHRELDLPVLMLSSFGPDDLLAQGLAEGVAGFVQKPLNRDELSVNLHLAVAKAEMGRHVQESERKYRGIFDNALAGIFRFRPEGPFLTTNNAFASMLGFTSVEDLMATIVNASAQIFSASDSWDEAMAILQTERELIGLETLVYGCDGQELWLMLQLSAAINDQGEITHVEGVALDITDRREAEENLHVTLNMLRQTVDNLPDPMALTDLDHNIILANSSLRTAMGLEQDSEGDFGHLLSSNDHKAWLAAFDVVTRNGKPCEFVGRLADAGQLRRISMAPYRDQQGELVGVIHLAVPHQDSANLETTSCANINL